MIKLYTSKNCVICSIVKKKLIVEGVPFIEHQASSSMQELKEECSKRYIDFTMIKSMPVLISEDGVFTGHDCIVAIEEGGI